MRQTNIVWVGMALGITVIDKFVSQTLPFIKGNEKYGKSEHIYTFKVSTKWKIYFNTVVVIYTMDARTHINHKVNFLIFLHKMIGKKSF